MDIQPSTTVDSDLTPGPAQEQLPDLEEVNVDDQGKVTVSKVPVPPTKTTTNSTVMRRTLTSKAATPGNLENKNADISRSFAMPAAVLPMRCAPLFHHDTNMSPLPPHLRLLPLSVPTISRR